MRGLLSAILAALTLAASWFALPATPAAAQGFTPPTGTGGWCTPVGPGQEACFGSPAAACQRQWEVYGEPFLPPNGAAGPNQGPSPTSNWAAYSCHWTFLASPAPVAVIFKCDGFPYVAVPPGRCPLESDDYTQCEGGGRGGSGPNSGSYPAPCSPRPIQLLSGAKTFAESDFENSGSTLRLARHFNAFSGGGAPVRPLRTPLGAGNWAFGFAVELQLTSNLSSGIVTVILPEGVTLPFQKQTDGSLLPYTTSRYPLARKDYKLEMNGSWPSTLADLRLSSSSWTLTGPDATWTITTKLDPVRGEYVVGTPDAYAERQGPTWSFDYGSMGELETLSDQFGNELTFSWLTSPGGGVHPTAVSEVGLPGGYALRYSYEDVDGGSLAPDRLTKVEWVDSSNVVRDSKTYLYGDGHYPLFVTEIRDRNGVGRQFVEYQENGQAIRSSAALGAEETTVAYGGTSSVHTRTVTNPLGREAIYKFPRSAAFPNNTILAEVDEAASPNAPASTQTFASSSLSLTSQTDAEGRVTAFTRDSVGRPTQIVEAQGTALARTTSINWHSTFNVPTQIVAPGLTTDFTYDGAGRPLTRTLTDTTTHTVPYSTNGRTRVWTYDWTTGGLLESVDGPLSGAGDTTSYTYTAAGYLASTTNQVGHVVAVTSHDWRGAPVTVEDENDVETAFTYDIQGRPLTITVDPGPSQSAYALDYDAVGNLTKMTLPEGGWLEYAYDAANRLTGIENDRGETQVFTVNDLGQPLTQVVRDASSNIRMQQAQAYDELSRIVEKIGAGTQTWGFAYDKVNNLTQVTDARAENWGNAWDALNRIVGESDPETATVEYAYAPNNAVTQFEDGRDLATNRVVDGFGLTIFEASPDAGDTTYWYDAADRLTQKTDGDGQTTQLTYDASDRTLTQTFAGAVGETLTYTYDSTAGGNYGVGRLTGVTDASGSTSKAYDAQGRLVQNNRVIQGESYALGYGYDDNGEMTTITLPSGHVITYARDADGQVTGVTAQESGAGPTIPIVSNVAYEPFGPLKQLTYGSGLGMLRSYDQNYWLTGLEVSSLINTTLNLSFSRNENGSLDGVTDNALSGRDAGYGYTDSSRLQYAVGPWGNNSFSYDAAGNRVEVRTDTGGGATYEFAVMSPTSNQVTEVRDTSWALLRDLTYRDGGDLEAQSYAGGSNLDYDYNARKRLTQITENATVTATYAYDYLGRRVGRSLPGSGTDIHYIIDDEGRLLAEHDGSNGAMLREYIWIDDMPVALVADNGGTLELYFIHVGQIGEPLAVTDFYQNTVWAAAVDPWGRATMLTPPLGDLDLRLPGQWLQLETGLHQNWMRDYDPSLGRYIEVDRLGLAAGQNLYSYVDGDPLNAIDPRGEMGALVRALPFMGGAAAADGPFPFGDMVAVGIGVFAIGLDVYSYFRSQDDASCPPGPPDRPDYCAQVRRFCISACSDKWIGRMPRWDRAPFDRCQQQCLYDARCGGFDWRRSGSYYYP